MSYVARAMEDAHLERQWRAEIDRLRNEIEKRFRQVEFAMVPTPQISSSPNYLVNSGVSWSHLAYTTAGVYYGTSGDDNRRAYNWGIKASTDFTGTPYDPLVASGHSTYSGLDAQKPIWEQALGHIQMGWEADDTPGYVTYDVIAPLPRDILAAGQRYYVSFETRLDMNDDDLLDAQVFCGFYDALNEQWITGSDFVPQAVIYGQGGSRTLEYRVVATSDQSNQLSSTDVEVDGVVVSAVVNAPDVMSADNHVRIYFKGIAGFARYEIYRFDGLNYRKVGDIRNSIDLQFFDAVEDAGSVEAGFPTIAGGAPRAYVTTNNLVAELDKYTAHTLVLSIPSTFDKSTTSSSGSPNGNQFFRMGLTGPISRNRALRIRRVMVSEGYGPWTAAPQDFLAASGPSIIGDIIDLGPDVIVTPTPNNGANCVTLDTRVIALHDGKPIEMAIGEIGVGDEIVSGLQVLPVLDVIEGTVQSVFEIVTQTGKTVMASESHRFITYHGDTVGKPVKNLHEGDSVLVTSEHGPIVDRIHSIREIVGETPVKSLKLPAPHTYVTNGIISHNDKSVPNPWSGGGGSDPFIPLP